MLLDNMKKVFFLEERIRIRFFFLRGQIQVKPTRLHNPAILYTKFMQFDINTNKKQFSRVLKKW